MAPRDEEKFVAGVHADYLWARACLCELTLVERCTVLMGLISRRLKPIE